MDNLKEQIAKEIVEYDFTGFNPKWIECANKSHWLNLATKILSIINQAGYVQLQAGEDGLVNVDSICCTEDEINEIKEMAKIGISPDNHISYKQNYELLHQRKIVEKTSKAQKLLDEKLAYNMINEDGLLADDAIMELCLYGSTTLPYGTLLTPFEAAKRCVKAQKALDDKEKEGLEQILSYVSEVYCELTNGKFSKPDTDKVYILGAVEESYKEIIKQEKEEAVKNNNAKWQKKVEKHSGFCEFGGGIYIFISKEQWQSILSEMGKEWE